MPDSLLKLAAGSFGRIAALKQSGADGLYERLLEVVENPRANSSDIMVIASALAKQPDSYGILLDAAAHFGLADLYPAISRQLAAITAVHLEPEIGIFKIVNEIKKNIN